MHSDGWEGGEYLGEVGIGQIVIRIRLLKNLYLIK